MEIVAVLHNIRSLHNVGSIFRTADAAGVSKIYLGGITPGPMDRFGRWRQPLLKVSLGAEKHVEWKHFKSTAHLIDRLKKDGHKIFAIEQSKKSVPYYQIHLSVRRSSNRQVKIVLVLGNEIRGLPPSILKKADKILEIPMRGKKESLNVAVAFGVVAFHLANR